MNKIIKSKIIDSLKESYSFLEKEYGYSVIDEESSSSLFFYVRYENRAVERIISVSIDLRESELGIAIWKSSDGWTLDQNRIDFNDFLKNSGVNQSLKGAQFDESINMIEESNTYNSGILKEYGIGLIQGREGYS